MNDINTPINRMGIWIAYMAALKGNSSPVLDSIRMDSIAKKKSAIDINKNIMDMGIWKVYRSLGGSVEDIKEAQEKKNKQGETIIYHSAGGKRPGWKPRNTRSDITADMIIKERSAGKSFYQISKEHGASLATISGRVKGIKFEPIKRKLKRPDVTRELIIKELSKGKTWEQIALENNISTRTLKERVKKKM